MSDQNIAFVANELSKQLKTPEDFSTWIHSGVRSIVLDGNIPTESFPHAYYIIGAHVRDWKDDVGAVYRALPKDSQPLFRKGLAQEISSIEGDVYANDPGKNEGRNLERIATTYLSIARDVRCAECLPYIPWLIHTTFPVSQSVFDSSLLAWRVLAERDQQTNWHFVFSLSGYDGANAHPSIPEPRFRPSYTPVIAFGMSLAQPNNAHYFLNEWPPFLQYLESLKANPSTENTKRLEKINIALKRAREQSLTRQ